MKRILVVNGNPKERSLCRSLAETYVEAASNSGYDVHVFHISDSDFNPVLNAGYESRLQLEDSLCTFKQELEQADHVVMVYPVWWGSVPAGLKGLLDRVFLPGFAFKYEKDDLFPKRLLKGRSARLIITMDTPVWYYKLVYGSPATKMMKRTVLEFCGFSPVKVTEFGSVIKSSEHRRRKWITQVEKLGSQGL